MRRITALVTTALMAASCSLAPSVDCGPLDRATCEEEAAHIISVVQRDNPDGQSSRSSFSTLISTHA